MKVLVYFCLAIFAGMGRAKADMVILQADLDSPVVLAGQKQHLYLKVAIDGQTLADNKRIPANVAIVLDRSGSMAGQKLRDAKKAAMQAIRRLAKNDIVSVVAYDDNAKVVVPATKVTDQETIIQAIAGIEDGGSTALFAGVAKGAAELRKFLNREHANRIILLSDGLANVGPSSPSDLAELGASLAKEGISVTTLGLGLDYNEDLMTRLAMASDGNHAFIENSANLAQIFAKEFGDILAVVAQDLFIEINCAEGMRPLRVLGKEVDIDGNKVIMRINQLYAQQQKFIILEVDAPAVVLKSGQTSSPMQLATVQLSYDDMETKKRTQKMAVSNVSYANSQKLVDQSVNSSVKIAVAELMGAEKTKLAVKLRDEGKKQQAQVVLQESAKDLDDVGSRYGSEKLKQQAKTRLNRAEQLDDDEWKRSRKNLREDEYKSVQQQKY